MVFWAVGRPGLLYIPSSVIREYIYIPSTMSINPDTLNDLSAWMKLTEFLLMEPRNDRLGVTVLILLFTPRVMPTLLFRSAVDRNFKGHIVSFSSSREITPNLSSYFWDTLLILVAEYSRHRA